MSAPSKVFPYILDKEAISKLRTYVSGFPGILSKPTLLYGQKGSIIIHSTAYKEGVGKSKALNYLSSHYWAQKKDSLFLMDFSVCCYTGSGFIRTFVDRISNYLRMVEKDATEEVRIACGNAKIVMDTLLWTTSKKVFGSLLGILYRSIEIVLEILSQYCSRCCLISV
jgi:hypothetical protein